MNAAPGGDDGKIVYWHRELPPVTAELIADHTVEATSGRVAGTLSHRDELWQRCYDELIDTRHDEATGEAWLHGQFSYMLYRRPLASR
ncbi:MAG TPA: hypothetical protein VES67_05175 [Vicinamibacterales bacterium]|nr:hypothetical protein [Vicinamibacterales bacterium]